MRTALFFAAVQFALASPAFILEIQESSVDRPYVCWKGFGEDHLSKTCSGDMSEGVCYEKCQESFTGFGQYCIKKVADKIETVERSTVSDSAVCPADSKMVMAFEKSVCVQASCPSHLPKECGLLCAKNAGVCASTIAGVSVAIVKIVKDLNDQNFPAVIAGVKILLDRLRTIPQCNEVQGQVVEAEMINSFIKLLKMN